MNLLPLQRPSDYSESYVSFIIPIHRHTSTKAEMLLKFGSVLAETFVKICRICCLVPKVTETPGIISGFSRPIAIKFLQNVATMSKEMCR